jgi:hypothetical protein
MYSSLDWARHCRIRRHSEPLARPIGKREAKEPRTYCAERNNKYVTHSHWGRHCKRKVHKQPLARPIGKQRVRCRGWNPKSESQASVHHDADMPPAAGRDSSLASHDEGGTQLIDDGLGVSIVRDDCTALLAKIKSICTSLEVKRSQNSRPRSLVSHALENTELIWRRRRRSTGKWTAGLRDTLHRLTDLELGGIGPYKTLTHM